MGTNGSRAPFIVWYFRNSSFIGFPFNIQIMSVLFVLDIFFSFIFHFRTRDLKDVAFLIQEASSVLQTWSSTLR